MRPGSGCLVAYSCGHGTRRRGHAPYTVIMGWASLREGMYETRSYQPITNGFMGNSF